MAGGPVLVVDDDTVSRHVLIQALANAELPHVAVASGTEALEQIECSAEVQPELKPFVEFLHSSSRSLVR